MSLIVIFVCLSRVAAELHSLQHHMYVSRKSRSNSSPVQSGYMYSQVDNYPGTLSSFGIGYGGATHNEPAVNDRKTDGNIYPPEYNYYDSNGDVKPVIEVTEPPVSKYAADYEIAKAEAKYNNKFLPSKIETDAMYERLKSMMYYHPPEGYKEMNTGYTSHDYNYDDDDVRTSSRSSYDTWPYYYHSPYEYEHMKIEAEIDKAKDKRYAVVPIIPVHENVDDVPQSYTSIATPNYYSEITTENPMSGHKPFFSFVLNDYFDKNSAGDALVFKGVDWGSEIDHESPYNDNYAYAKRNRRLDGSTINDGTLDSILGRDNEKTVKSKNSHGESVTEISHEKNNEFDKYGKGNHERDDFKTGYEHSGNGYRGFKDFIDSFSNKFGTEDHKKDSKYILERNEDKGQKKKGFRKVYHKDEYQEEDEFFDNSNNSVKSEEKGASKAHIGGSEALLRSQVLGAAGNEANAFAKTGNTEKKAYEDSHRGHDNIKGLDSNYKKYKDLVKSTDISKLSTYH
ncbi:uncharacterized protein LOC101745134 [Bombyx mori]|uniref:Cuticle protein n=1 Tax=Bombyx mori TaxID=7091 RepID=A0A8R2AI13_BOMMO|nr:uncharacterized protein LOC101745134 [Bombyx mori]